MFVGDSNGWDVPEGPATKLFEDLGLLGLHEILGINPIASNY